VVEVKFLIYGDSALGVEFGNEISEAVNSRVRALYNMIIVNKKKGILEMVPTFRSLLVYYDPCILSYKKLVRMLKPMTDRIDILVTSSKRIIEIPVCYGGLFGEDMGKVCNYTKLNQEEIIKRHSSRDYLIYMMGFLPGFAYLGGMDAKLVTPRLDNPRVKINAGSVGIGGEQTGIYPLDSPGGWNLIGMTPVKPYLPYRKEPTLYKSGDYIRFKSISEEEFYEIQALTEKNEYTCTIIEGGTEDEYQDN